MDDWVVPETKPTAIVAVIDDGIPFAHHAFLDTNDRTRMSHVWLQSAKADERGAVPFGRELMNGNINALRASMGPDENLIYRTAGAIDPAMPELGHHMRRQATHGSHIAGMCAGNDSRLSNNRLATTFRLSRSNCPTRSRGTPRGLAKRCICSARCTMCSTARAQSRQNTRPIQTIQKSCR